MANPFIQNPFDKLADDLNGEANAPLPGQRAAAPTQQAPDVTRASAPAAETPTAAPATESTPEPETRRPTKVNNWLPPADMQRSFDAAAQKHNVPVNVLMALGHQESRYNPRAVGPETKWGRARGSMQYLDSTAKGLGINPMDADQSINAAALQIRQRLDKGYSMPDAVMEHFAGPDRKLWGAKTAVYGKEVMGKATTIGNLMMGGAAGPAAQPAKTATDTAVPADWKRLTEEQAAEIESKRANGLSSAMPRAIYQQTFAANNPGASPEATAFAMESFDKAKAANATARMDSIGKVAPVPTPQQFFDDRLNKRLAGPANGIVPQLPGKLPSDVDDFSSLSSADRETKLSAAQSFLAKSFEAGVYDLAGAGAKVLDEINPWTTTPADAAVLFKNDPAKLKMLQDSSATMVLSRFSQAMTKNSEEAMAEMSPGAKARYAGLQYETTDTAKAAYLSPVKVIGDAVRSLPSSLAMALSIYFTRGASARAEVAALEAGMTPALAREAAIAAGAKAMAKAGAISEGAVGYAQQSNQTTLNAGKTTDAMMQASPKYQELLKNGYTPETARAKVVADTAEQSGRIAGIVDAAVNKVGGEFLGRILTEGGKFLPRVFKGMANESATEFVQSAGEQFGDNVAMQGNINPNQDLGQGVAEAAIGGGVVGGVMGGTMAAIGGRGPSPVQPPAPKPAPPTKVNPAPPDAAPPARPSGKPLGDSLANAAEVPKRVILTADDGEIAGTLQSYQEDGNGGYIAQVVGDDGQVYEITDQDGVQITPVAPAPGPLTGAIEQAAEEVAAAQPEIPVLNDVVVEGSDYASIPVLNEVLVDGADYDSIPVLNDVIEPGAPDAANEVTPVVKPPAPAAAILPPAVEAKPTTPGNPYLTQQFPDQGKADAFIAKKGISDGYEVQQTGKGRFQIKPIAAGVKPSLTAEVAPTPPVISEAAPAVSEAPAAVSEAATDTATAPTPATTSTPAPRPAATAPSPTMPAPAKKLTGKANIADTERRLAEHFTPGNVIKSYSGNDRVISYTPSDAKGDGFAVRVQAVVQQDGQWVPAKNERERSHSTRPSDAEMKNGVVARAAPVAEKVPELAPSAPTSQMRLMGRKSALDGYSRQYPSNVRKIADRAQWQDGWFAGNKEREVLLSGAETVQVGDRKAIPTLNRQHNLVWRDDRAGVDYENAEAARAVFAAKEPSARRPSPEAVAPKPAAEPASTPPPAGMFDGNKLFTADKVAAARARMKSKLGTLNSGLDPELVVDGMTLAGAYIEAGTRKFSAYAKAMVDDFGPKIQPFLLSFYEAVRHYPGLDTDGMSTPDVAKKQHDAMLMDAPEAEAEPDIGPTATPPKKETAISLRKALEDAMHPGWVTQGHNPTGDNLPMDFSEMGETLNLIEKLISREIAKGSTNTQIINKVHTITRNGLSLTYGNALENIITAVRDGKSQVSKEFGTNAASDGELFAKTETVSTPSGREFEVRHKIVEAADLTTSNRDDGSINPDFPQDLQPRDRTRQASQGQVNDIAAKLNPRLLGESASATDGAPIVSSAGIVESGNGRTMAIRRAYERNLPGAAKYRAWLAAQGYEVDGMTAPVLVRERVTPMTNEELRAYTQESNDRTTLDLSPTERAMSDAEKIGPIMSQYIGGEIDLAGNRPFIRAFVQDVAAASDRGGLMDANGMLSQGGKRRIEAAMLAAAYDDAAVVADLFESTDSDIKSIGGALLDVSGDWAKMRDESRSGAISSGIDVTKNLIEAVNVVRRARAEGRPVLEFVNQDDIFSGGMDPLTKDFLSVFYRGDSMNRARSRDRVAEALRFYSTQARQSKPGTNLFGDPEQSGADLMKATNDRTKAQDGQASQQQDIFASARPDDEDTGQPGAAGPGSRTGAQDQTTPEGEVSDTTSSSESLRGVFEKAIIAGDMPKDNPALRKMVESFDGKPADQTRLKEAQETLEAAIAQVSRSIVAKRQGARSTFDTLLNLYESQPNLNVRTSTSIENQAYSTPAPLAFLASELAGITASDIVLEPTAGTGLLLIGSTPSKAVVNELEPMRAELLRDQGYTVTQDDATKPNVDGAKKVNKVITNPPFGAIKDNAGNSIKAKVDGYSLGQIDHLIAARALERMEDAGGATLIIGANKMPGGISNNDLIFFNWLYGHYNVTSHFEVDGDLYQRQGAGWPVRVITIKGRQASSRVSPAAGSVQRANNWSEVYEQFDKGLDAGRSTNSAATTPSVRDSFVEAPSRTAPEPAGAKARRTGKSGQGSGQAGAGTVARAGTGNVVDSGAKPTGPVGSATGAQRGDAATADGSEMGQSGQPAKRPGAKPTGDRGATGLATGENEFQSAYVPRSSRKDEGVLIPVNMMGPTQDGLSKLEDEVGDIDQFAMLELGYASIDDLHDAFMGLQIDSVASAIHQIKRGKGIIIADQTGIGKGRQAAAVIRWAARNGHIPVFVTVKPSLFTDMYGDLADIGTDDIVPFIMNSSESIKGADGDKLFSNKPATHRRNIDRIAGGQLPANANAIFMTYSQINVANAQRAAVMGIADRAVFILDESHNAGGESATGAFIQEVLALAKGVTYLSATYAKRPDNMPVYFKTDIGDAVADSATLMQAMESGGLPLQTVVSNNLVRAGQMFRRERSYDGVNIESRSDSGRRVEHEKLSNETTLALRAIVAADKQFHEGFVADAKLEAQRDGARVLDNAGNQAGDSVNHTEFSSVVHNFVRQMLMGLKAQAAADEAIASLNRGEKPLIALENTMGSFLAEYAENNNLKAGGSLGSFDYRTVLSRALERTRYITRQLPNGDKVKQAIALGDLDPVTRNAYDDAQQIINGLKINIPVSPIDWMRNEIQKAGYSVAEITGRNLSVDYSNPKKPVLSSLDALEQKDKVNTTRRFNSGRLDAIILNVAGSTGISLHSSERFEDQRQRHMIVAQPAQDINIFMQMLGRIHRTGQVNLPKYTILNVDLPAEKRPTALLSKKMKSLNANTSSNTESATSVKSADMLNKYGDQIIGQYLADDTDLAFALGIESPMTESGPMEDVARKATGRLALMPVETQQGFYEEVEAQYEALMGYLNQTNQNDLEPRTFDFDAKELKQEVLFEGANKASPFGEDAIYGEYSVKAQGKAMKPDEIRATIAENLGGQSTKDHALGLVGLMKQQTVDGIEGSRDKNGIGDTFNEAKFRSSMEGQRFPSTYIDSAAESLRGQYARGEKRAPFTIESIPYFGEFADATIAFIRSHPIGSSFRVDVNGDIYNAVVTNLRSTHKGRGSPFAMSKMLVTVALNGALRSVTVPATQFKRIEVSGLGFAPIDDLFAAQPDNQREVAKIVTGNLLAAYGELSGVRGTVISFTKEDGTQEQGILMPKIFNFAKNTIGDYRLKTGADAYRFLMEGNDPNLARFGVATRDGIVRVTPSGSGIVIQVPKSKAKGGKYFLDDGLRSIVGDFVSSGNVMRATATKANAEKAMDAVMRKQALYASASMAEGAKAMLDPSAATAPKLSVSGDAKTSELTPATLRAAVTSGPLGPVVNSLIESGAIVLHADASTLPRNVGAKASGIQAVTMPDGTIHLVASGLSEASATPVLLHEAFHQGVEKLIDTAAWGGLMNRLGSLYRQAEQSSGKAKVFFDRARKRVSAARARGAVTPQMEVEEFAAYAIEEYESAPPTVRKWVSDLIGQVKAWALKRFGAQLGAVTPGQLSALAKMALQDVAAARQSTTSGDMYSAVAPVNRLDMHFKDVVKRTPELTIAANQLMNGEIDRAQYDDLVNAYKPVEAYKTVPEPATNSEMASSLTAEKVPMINLPRETLTEGHFVGLRLDIPAYRDHGTWIVSVHEGKRDGKGGQAGKAIGYQSTARIRGVNLGMAEKGALKIAAGAAKGTIATIGGEWVNATPQETASMARKALQDPAWVQVGMDPERHAYFYDRATMQPVTAGDEAIQIGGLVMVKNPVYGEKDDFLFSVRPEDAFTDLTDPQKDFLRKIGPVSVKTKLAERWRQLTDNLALRARQAGVDRYAALFENDKALYGADTLEGSIASSSWVLARMSASAAGAVTALLDTGRIYLDKTQKVIDILPGTQGLSATLRTLGSPAEIDRFMGWIAANRARKLLGEGRENLFTEAEIVAAIKLSSGRLANGKSRGIAYSKAWKEFQQIRDDVLGIAEQAGIITPIQRETWSEEFYVPFYRVMDEEKEGVSMSFGGSSGLSRQQAYKKLKGGKQHLNDLLENTLLNFHHLLQASLKNQAALQAVENAVQLGIAEPTPEFKRDKKLSTFVMDGGEKRWYNINDPLTFKALSALMDGGLNNPVMKAGRTFKRFFTNMTTATPQFIVANALRDTLSAMATSPTSAVPFKTAAVGMKTYLTGDNKARMMASGAAFSFGHIYGSNPDEVKASMSGQMRAAGIMTDPMLIPHAVAATWRGWKRVTDVSENANRAGIWQRNIHKGKLKASFEARDLMDFSAHGDAIIVRIVTDLVPFVNARIQGLDKLYRSGIKPGAKVIAGKGTKADRQAFARFAIVAGALSLVSMALFLNNYDDEEYRKLEDWQRDSYWVVRVGDSMYFMPKPFEVGSIATLAERALEQFIDPSVGGSKFASRLGHIIAETFAMNPIPQMVKPLYELGANKNSFTGRKIEQPGMERLSPSLRSTPSTTRLAEGASLAMESTMRLAGLDQAALSPLQIDHLIAGYTGQIGSSSVAILDTMWRSMRGEQSPDKKWIEYQPIKRFYKDLSIEDNYTRYGTDFYNALEKSSRAYANVQHMQKMGELERAEQDIKRDTTLLGNRRMLTQVNGHLSKINAMMKQVQRDTNMDGADKRKRLDDLRAMRNQATKQVVQVMEANRMKPD